MLRIGDFSRLGRITVKALRYYDEVGLLKPARIDTFTGYRYYSIQQLQQLNRILALKDLGFSLEEIAKLSEHYLPLEQLRRMLQAKRDELQRLVHQEQERLERVEARLKIIEQEHTMAQYDVVLKQLEPQLVASVREVIPNAERIGETFARIFDEVYDHVQRHNGQIVGHGFDLWYDPWHDSEPKNPKDRQQDLSVEAAIPIGGPLPQSERVKVNEIPGVDTMACVVHHGSFDGFPHAYGAVLTWIETNGYRVIGPYREVYLHYERNGDERKYVTEIQFPIAK